MTREIQKFTIVVDKSGMDPVIKVTEGAQFLTLNHQAYNGLSMAESEWSAIFDSWWSLDPNTAETEVQLYIRVTLDRVPPSATYLGSFFQSFKEFHVFQKDVVFEDLHIVDGKFVPRSQ